MVKLGVNIDHIATLREVRGNTFYPSPLKAALTAIDAGADGITLHLREDRRHIQDSDVEAILKESTVPVNLEMAAIDEMLAIALMLKPEHCCLVPEKREELTTEGGLDVVSNIVHIKRYCGELAKASIQVSLFIDPDVAQIDAAKQCGVPVIELHTGAYVEASGSDRKAQLDKLFRAAEYAHQQGIIVNAGHGLDYENVVPVLAMPHLNELNIGHSIICQSVFLGLHDAVAEMKSLL